MLISAFDTRETTAQGLDRQRSNQHTYIDLYTTDSKGIDKGHQACIKGLGVNYAFGGIS